ncbi:sensor histidine kinase [Halothiobacillus neapolitanus]|uniref:histidine kinase n=1 Tax=Halothiobacillus neapolitanus (strain ATCC 23641 / DSM 15147 / CIP 104769 / NCIMB 8539 / c2) TaxID=555778 RepID=D0KWW4_HALNC|nr:ATP-binding protein [Halothiobacillus neapolitanus]ACX97084.1 multi-sensor signal transduction histidine kinase [Halothiobacillus neapolitanus c2]TDN58046.1 two-component system sensor histidine kinase PilS (NtrC family) [Halothiobacillus neapolitanus]
MISIRNKNSQAYENDNWRGIRLVNAYRVFLAFAFVAASISGRGPQVFGQQDPYLFGFVAWGYLVLAMGFEFLLELHVLPFRPQAHLHALGDIIVLVFVMHASGGPGGGIALLMIIAVGLSAVLLGATAAMGYAALASILVLGETMVSSLVDHEERQFAAAGFLGFALFVVAILVATFEQRVQRIERLTRRKEKEIHYLSTLAVQIIERSPNGILITDPSGQVDYINSAARQLLAIRRRDDVQGDVQGVASDAPTKLRLRDTHPVLANALQNWFDGQITEGIEYDQPHRFRAEFHALQTELGQRALVVLVDLSVEDARVQQNKLASLGRLTASIAHEVRNPLSSIRQASELLADSTSQEERAELIPIIIRHSARINTLVEGVLDVARRPQVQPTRIDFNQWLNEFVELHRLNWDASSVVWQAPEKVDAACALTFDVSHLWQIMDNLVTNAMRHGRSADDVTYLKIACQLAEPDTVMIRVCDRGPGLSDTAVHSLFEPFFTTHVEGVGLGLYVSRELALSNGAQLYAEAAGDDAAGSIGTCFVLRCPRAI